MTDDARERRERDRDASPEDERLIGELEALYRRVASLDQPEGDRDEGPILVPDAMFEADGSGASTPPTSSLPPSGLSPDPAVHDRGAVAPSRKHTQTSPASPDGRRPGLFPVGVLAGGMLLYAVLFWPGLYHYEAIRMGGREYPIRINRLTTHVQYFNGQSWLDPPLQITAPGPTSDPTAPPLAPAPIIFAWPANSREPEASPPPPEASLRTPMSRPPEPRAGDTVTGKPPPATTAPQKRRSTFQDHIGLRHGSGRPYTVQIGACRSPRKAEFLAAEIRRRGFPVRIETVSIDDRRWHRVLVGRFANRDAAGRWLQEHGFADDYPDSFVQKSVGS